MSEFSKVVGIVDIKCPKCGNEKSYQKILFDFAAEFGECTSCGALTYQKTLNGTSQGSEIKAQCPYCNSTNTKKISGASKAATVAVFGLFGLSKASKQWHCNNCKSDF